MPRCNVVITGIGVVSSIGIGADPFFQSLLSKRSGVRSLADRSDDGARPPADRARDGFWIGAPIVDFDPKQYVRPRKSLKVMCREIQTAFAASQLAIEHAGLADWLPARAEGPVQPHQLGTVFGSEMFYGTPAELVDAVRQCQREDGQIEAAKFGNAAMKHIMPLWMLKYLPNMPACQIGISVNSQGPNNSLVLGDVSGSAALLEAASCIDRQIAAVMISGSTGTRISTTRINYRSNLPVPAASDPLPRSSRPHDRSSQGVVGGEGSAALVIESAEHAAARGAAGVARMIGYTSCFFPSGGISNGTLSGPRGSQQAIDRSIQTTLTDCRLSPADIGLIVSHGCGDPQWDSAERAAIRRRLPDVPVVAPIAAVGHTGAASGSIELATGALSIVHGVVPPTHSDRVTRSEINFCDQPKPLPAPHVLCLSHTAEGNAIAIALTAAG